MDVKNLKLSRMILISIGVLAPLMVWLIFGERGLLHLYHAELERQEHMERIRTLAEENRAMMAEIERLRNDMKYIEQLARKELNMVKPNETIYRFRNSADRPEDLADTETSTKDLGADDDSGSRSRGRQAR